MAKRVGLTGLRRQIAWLRQSLDAARPLVVGHKQKAAVIAFEQSHLARRGLMQGIPITRWQRHSAFGIQAKGRNSRKH
jgi:hypothetical protein